MQNDWEERRIYNILTLFALLIRCPAGHATEGGDCPFAEFRRGCDLEEKFMIAENLPDDICRKMLGFHESCLAGISTTRETPSLHIFLDAARGFVAQKELG
jgi:hypothetical protein